MEYICADCKSPVQRTMIAGQPWFCAKCARPPRALLDARRPHRPVEIYVLYK